MTCWTSSEIRDDRLRLRAIECLERDGAEVIAAHQEQGEAMIELDRLYHLTHVVTDLEAADAWYDDVFGALPVKHVRDQGGTWDASIVVVGDLIIEANAPVGPPDRRGVIGKYHDRHGEHLYSTAIFVRDAVAANDHLLGRGVRAFDQQGAPVSAGYGGIIWTHPRDTVGQFEFAEVPKYHFDPRLHPSWTGDYWRHTHRLGIDGVSHLTVLFHDVERSKPIYEDLLGQRLLLQEAVDGRRSWFYTLGSELLVEARQPAAGTRAAADLERVGEGMYGFTLRVGDLGAVGQHLAAKGMPTFSDVPGTLAMDPPAAFGMEVGFTTRRFHADHLSA
jgi:catechol 2,3-dioxygenase-like lactoylglutathione lyase family enzyme